ncbi:MAG: hypothetical protein GY937_23550 [bacterium]|nr:hypothetical protein [bacterium]
MSRLRSLLSWAGIVGLLAVASGAEPSGAPEPPAEAIVGVLPFVPGYPTRVMIDLAPDGQEPFVMMLDTGATVSVMTPSMARALGVRVRRVKSSPYRRTTRLGRDLQFHVDTRTSDTGSKTGFEYGLLGSDFLDDYVVELDYPGERVRFLDPRKYSVPEATDAPDERVTSFERAGTRILTEIEIGGKIARVLLETGAPDSAILSGNVARKLGIEPSTLQDFGEVGTVMGPMKVLLMETDTFRWAGFPFPSMPLLVAPNGWYNMAPNDSAIGYDVLRQFVIRIDYKRKRLWLKRSGDTHVTFGGADWALVKELGALFTPVGPGVFWVWHVEPEGWAASHGLREGDAIIDPKAKTILEIRERLESGKTIQVDRAAEDGERVVIDVGG